MAKKKLNVGLIGYQFMGKAHSNAYRQAGHFFDLPAETLSGPGSAMFVHNLLRCWVDTHQRSSQSLVQDRLRPSEAEPRPGIGRDRRRHLLPDPRPPSASCCESRSPLRSDPYRHSRLTASTQGRRAVCLAAPARRANINGELWRGLCTKFEAGFGAFRMEPVRSVATIRRMSGENRKCVAQTRNDVRDCCPR